MNDLSPFKICGGILLAVVLLPAAPIIVPLACAYFCIKYAGAIQKATTVPPAKLISRTGSRQPVQQYRRDDIEWAEEAPSEYPSSRAPSDDFLASHAPGPASKYHKRPVYDEHLWN